MAYQGENSGASYDGRKDGAALTITDPEASFYFALEIDNIEIANFLECSGLKTTTEVFEIEEGGNNQFTHKLPGRTTWENIILKYGVTADISMLSWRNEILQGHLGNRRNGAVIMKDRKGSTVRRYTFVKAWAVSWEGPAFNAANAEIAIETMELAHEGITVSFE
jgi:phage tail-like protein